MNSTTKSEGCFGGVRKCWASYLAQQYFARPIFTRRFLDFFPERAFYLESHEGERTFHTVLTPESRNPNRGLNSTSKQFPETTIGVPERATTAPMISSARPMIINFAAKFRRSQSPRWEMPHKNAYENETVWKIQFCLQRAPYSRNERPSLDAQPCRYYDLVCHRADTPATPLDNHAERGSQPKLQSPARARTTSQACIHLQDLLY